MKAFLLLILFSIGFDAHAETECGTNFKPSEADFSAVAFLQAIQGAYDLGQCQFEVRLHTRCGPRHPVSQANINAEILVGDSSGEFFIAYAFSAPVLRAQWVSADAKTFALSTSVRTLIGKSTSTFNATINGAILRVQAQRIDSTGKKTKWSCEGITPASL